MCIVWDVSVVDIAGVWRGPSSSGRLIHYAGRRRGNICYFFDVSVLGLKLGIRRRRVKPIFN